MAPERLTDAVKAAVVDADVVYVSPISVYEVTRKVRLGKWPDMAPHVDALVAETETLAGTDLVLKARPPGCSLAVQ